MFSKSKNEVSCYRKSDLICTVVCEDAIYEQYTLDKSRKWTKISHWKCWCTFCRL